MHRYNSEKMKQQIFNCNDQFKYKCSFKVIWYFEHIYREYQKDKVLFDCYRFYGSLNNTEVMSAGHFQTYSQCSWAGLDVFMAPSTILRSCQAGHFQTYSHCSWAVLDVFMAPSILLRSCRAGHFQTYSHCSWAGLDVFMAPSTILRSCQAGHFQTYSLFLGRLRRLYGSLKTTEVMSSWSLSNLLTLFLGRLRCLYGSLNNTEVMSSWSLSNLLNTVPGQV